MPFRVSIPKQNFAKQAIVTFSTASGGKIVNGIVTRVGNSFYAFQNLCKHVPITLDAGDDNVTTEDQVRLQCHMHGAIYEPDSGVCVAGPCVGSKLNQFKVIEESTRVIVELPSVVKDV